MDEALKQQMAELAKIAGSIDNAAILIKEALKCSLSKSMKIAAGKYQYEISHSETVCLADLLKRSRKPRPTLRQQGKSAAS